MGYASERFRQQRVAKRAVPKAPYQVSWGGGPMLDFSSLRAPTAHESLLGTAPTPELKGKLNGNCNREACQRPGADWFNTSTRAYYCSRCARDINRACERFDDPLICFLTAGVEADAAMKFGDTR